MKIEKRKILIAVLLGCTYWILFKIAYSGIRHSDDDVVMLVSLLMSLAVPFVLGFIFVFVSKSKKYSEIFYCLLIFVTYYMFELIRDFIIVLPVYTPTIEHYMAELNLASVSAFFSFLGWLAAVGVKKLKNYFATH